MQLNRITFSIVTVLAVCIVTTTSGGCSITRITADTTTKLFDNAVPALESYWDYELAGQALPANIIQLEGVLRSSPTNRSLILQLIRAYMGYAYGWVEDDMEEAFLQGDEEKAAKAQNRARLLYQRAQELGVFLISLDAPGLEAHVGNDFEAFKTLLSRNFTQASEAAPLFWTGYAWASMINLAKTDIEVVAGLSYAKALVQKSIELDNTYFHSSGMVFLAAVESQELAGQVEKSKALFEKALEMTERRMLMVQVQYAKTYAVKIQNRALYLQLLDEVLEAGDVYPEARLSNQISKRKATRYKKQVDELF